MKGQDHTFGELTIDPWIYLLAILIGLMVLFFVCATRVQASPNAPASLDASAAETETMPADHKTPDNQFKVKALYGDYSDISNEKAGNPATSLNRNALKGTLRTEGKRSLLGSILIFFKSFFGFGDSDLDALDVPPAYVTP